MYRFVIITIVVIAHRLFTHEYNSFSRHIRGHSAKSRIAQLRQQGRRVPIGIRQTDITLTHLSPLTIVPEDLLDRTDLVEFPQHRLHPLYDGRHGMLAPTRGSVVPGRQLRDPDLVVGKPLDDAVHDIDRPLCISLVDVQGEDGKPA